MFGGIGWKEIFLILIGYIIVRFVLGVRRARKTMMDMRDQMEEEMRNAEKAANQKPEGEITIDRGVPKKKNNSSDSGEYVDFEEVD